jgi:activator of HSP90 ATPase
MKLTTTIITQEFIFPGTPIAVYEVLVEPKKHAAMTGAAAEGEAKVGGSFTAWDGYISGKYLKLAKGSRIVCEWTTTEWPAGYPPSQLDLTLTRSKEGTKLTMVHSKVPSSQAEAYRQGWIDSYWKPLKEYLQAKKRAAR